jgi:glycosyltransferase involved in cell wall biosynthesis
VAEQATNPQPKVLHILPVASEEVFSYNELCLARAGSRAIGICTFFPSEVEVPPRMRLYEGDGSFRGFFTTLKRAQTDGKYDVVHAHSPHVACLLFLWCLAARRPLPPTVFTVEHSYSNSNLKTRNRLLDLVAFALSHRVVIVSEAAMNSFPAAYRRLAGARIRVVPHAADLARLDRRRETRRCVVENRPFTVTCVGRLIPIKNPEAIVRWRG